jgi:CheY-like chemotaxis protein
MKGAGMGKSVLEGKTILAVDDEPDLLELLKEEILDACPSCRVETATSFEQATEMLGSNPYDLVILDIMGVRGFEILDQAVEKRLPVVMLTAHALTPEALNLSLEKGARAYLSKEKLMEIVPYLEDALTYEHLPGWKRLFKKMDHFFSSRWGEHWKGNEKEFWKELEEKSRRIRW